MVRLRKLLALHDGRASRVSDDIEGYEGIDAAHIERATRLPLLHIADATASAVRQAGVGSVGLLGTKFTMEKDFYRGRLAEHGLDVVVPSPEDRDIVHRVIYEELCLGRIENESRAQYLRIIDDLRQRGAEAVIEGCTEIGLLVKKEHTDVRLFDTTTIHAHQAVAAALE